MIRALVVDPTTPAGVRLTEVPPPVPADGQITVDVHYASLNLGDLNDAKSGRVPPGAVLGSDVAGVVVQVGGTQAGDVGSAQGADVGGAQGADVGGTQAGDVGGAQGADVGGAQGGDVGGAQAGDEAGGRAGGSPAGGQTSGPPVGARVVGLTAGAFASRVAVDVNALAVVPDKVDLAHAAALPVAGLAALQSLRAAGVGPGKRVLVTGASGGVGRFAVRLAALAGATVIASVGSAARGAGLAADEVIVGLAGLTTPVDIVIDSVGGPQLVEVWGLLAPGGNIQSIGWSSGEPAVFPPYATVGPPKSLTSFLIDTTTAGKDLAELVAHLAEGRLRVEVGWQGDLSDFETAADALRGRKVAGKAILSLRL